MTVVEVFFKAVAVSSSVAVGVTVIFSPLTVREDDKGSGFKKKCNMEVTKNMFVWFFLLHLQPLLCTQCLHLLFVCGCVYADAV